MRSILGVGTGALAGVAGPCESSCGSCGGRPGVGAPSSFGSKKTSIFQLASSPHSITCFLILSKIWVKCDSGSRDSADSTASADSAMGVPGRFVCSSEVAVVVVTVAEVSFSLLTGATTAAGTAAGTDAGICADVGDGAAGACAGAGFVSGTGGIPCGGGGLVFTETDSIRVSWSELASIFQGSCQRDG